ncbi:hypothetical protein MRX96_051087 [Rhipicephalus microplus]
MLLAMTNISGSPNTEDDAPELWLNRETRLRLREAERCFEERDDDRQLLGELRDLLAAQIAHGHFRRSARASGKVLPLRLPRGGGDEGSPFWAKTSSFSSTSSCNRATRRVAPRR